MRTNEERKKISLENARRTNEEKAAAAENR